MPLLRRLAGLLMALGAGLMYPFAILFASGNPEDPAYGVAFGVFGLFGIYLPVLLCGLHLMFFGGERSVRARAIMVGLLAFGLIVTIFAMLPFILVTPRRDEAAGVIFSALVMAALFGWPMVRGLLMALASRKG